MADKRLKISLDLDDRAFTSAVRRMQDQLSQIQAGPNLLKQQQQISQKMQQLGLGSLPGAPSDQQSKQAQQKARQESDKIFEESRRKMEIIKKLQSDLNREQTSGLATEERKLQIRQRLVELTQMEKRTTGEMTALVKDKEFKISGAPLGGGAGASDLMGVTKTVLGALGLGVGLSALVNFGKQVYSSYVNAPAQTNLATGSAAQSTVGYLNQQILSGDVTSQVLLQGQMGKGRGIATSTYDKNLTNIASKYLAAAGDIASDMSNYLFGTNLDTNRYRGKFESGRAAEIGRSTLEQAQASIAQDNSMVLAQGFLSQNFGRNLTAERALGLGTNQFQRMQMGVNNAGFLTNQATDMLSQIQGAGGSAAGPGAGSLATLGLQAQRAFSITNAGNVLGKLSGVYGSKGFQQTDEAAKRILEEAVKKGFDKSENTEIMRKFVETSSEMVYQGEARKAEDVERLTKDFSQLLGDNPTIKQFEAASTAYQKYQSLTSETQGRGGTLGFAAFAGNKSFSKLSPLQIGNLQALPENRITTTNSDIVAAAAQQGISPQEMVQQVLAAKQQQALGTIGLSQKQLAPLKKYLGGRGLETISNDINELNKLKTTNPQAYEAYQALQTRAPLSGMPGSDEEKKMMMNQLLLGPAGITAPGAAPTGIAERLATGTGGKKEEELIAAQAGQEKQMVLNLKALQDNLYPTNQSLRELTQTIIGLGDAARVLTEGERARGLLQGTPLAPLQTKAAVSRTPSTGSKPKTNSQ